MEWTQTQLQVLEHHEGWLQVRAAAGTGKTALLVERWRRARHAGHQERALVLCRSRDAADRFRRAALADGSWAGESLPFTTMYGHAFDLLRRHGVDRRLLTRAEQWTVVRRMLAADGVAQWRSCPDFLRRAAFVDEVAVAILEVEASGASDDAVLSVAEAGGQAERWRDLLAFRHRYRSVTAAMGAVDGVQLFTEAAQILEDRMVATEEAARWDEVLIDDADALTWPMGRLIERLAPSVLVAAGDAVVRSDGMTALNQPWFHRFDWPSTVSLTERHRAPVAAALVPCRHRSNEPDAIAAILLEAHHDGVAWSDMAVLVRSLRQRAQGIGRGLVRYGIPVRVMPGSPAAEPAVRVLTDFFSWASGDESALDRLLVSPAVDFGPGELRHLRRLASAGGPMLAEHPRVARLVKLRDALAPTLESADPADLVHRAWTSLLGGLVPDPDAQRLDVIGARAMDAVSAFLSGVADRASNDPAWRIADELALVEGPDFDPDPWVPLAGPDEEGLVAVSTIWAAGGQAWDTVVVAGCLEGELPRVSSSVRFFDRAVPECAADLRRSAEAGVGTLGDRRRASLAAERRLFSVAASRARRRLFATAAPAPGQLVSRFVVGAFPHAVRLARPTIAAGTAGLPPAAETAGPVPVNLDGRLRLSATRLMTYDDCPLRYFYQYTLGVRGAGGVAASMGTIVHSALADFLDPEGAAGHTWAALESLAQSHWDLGSETIAPYQPMREQARRDIFAMLHRWWQTEAAQAEASGAWPDVVAVEYPFEIVVGGHRVRGSIDRIDRVPGGIAIIDYKTGARVLRPDDVAEDLQLATYHLAAIRDPTLASIGPPVSLHLCYLRSGAQPGQTITDDHAGRTEQRIVDAANRILSEDFEPSVEADCDYCDFWRLCPLQIQGRHVGRD